MHDPLAEIEDEAYPSGEKAKSSSKPAGPRSAFDVGIGLTPLVRWTIVKDVLTYRGIAYRQSNAPEAPWVASLVIAAEELLRWASIPRRTEGHLLGFQRAASDDRVKQAKGFFENPNNQSPTALIVGLHPDQNSIFEFKLADSDIEGSPSQRYCELSIDIEKLEARTLRQEAEYLKEQFLARLSTGTLINSEEVDDPAADTLTDQEIEVDFSDDDSAEDSDEVDRDVELGESILGKLLGLLDDELWVEGNAELVSDLAKPATIIDGQHRVLGAASLERMIPFAVCVLVDCSWPEQVFQFTVVNYTSSRIPDSFITANAALSLTEDELRGLQTRLVQAGVKVVEYELMRVVNFDSQSPFFNLVNLAEKKDPAKIGYKTMVRVAKAWYEHSKSDVVKTNILPNLYPELAGNKNAVKRERGGNWQRNDWGDFFNVFWRAIYDKLGVGGSHVPGHLLWDVGHSQLMVAVVLERLQATLMDNLARQHSSFFKVDDTNNAVAKSQLIAKIDQFVREFVDECFPVGFFATKWNSTSLSTGPGRRALDDALDQMVKKKGKWGYATSALVTGSYS